MKLTPRSSPFPPFSARFMWTVGLGALLSVCAPLSLAQQVAAPVISPPAGEYSPDPVGSGNPPVTLTMTSATEGATIYFVIRDNNVISVFPTHLPPYDPANKPVIAQAGTRWVGAMAVKAGMEDSDVVWQEYVINAPVIELVGYLSFSNVGIGTSSEKLISIYNRGNMDMTITSITMESDDPWAWSHDFSGPLVVLASHVTYLRVTFAPTEVKQYSMVLSVESDAAGGNNVRNASGTGFDPTVVAPITITAAMGEPYFAPVTIQLYSSTAGASLRYTIDGSEPTEDSLLYDYMDKPTLTTPGQVVVKARGFKDGLTASGIASETFNVVELELTASQDFWFDPTKIDDHQDKYLVLTNVGSRPIDITSIDCEDEHWTVPDWTGPVTIPVGGDVTYTIRFSPTERFDLLGTMTISTNANGGNLVRTVQGFGLASDYGVDPATKNVSGAGASYTVYVTGPGTWTASEILDWVSVVATPSLGMLVVTVSPNTTGEIRTGNVAVGARTHSITQSHMDPYIGGEHVSGLEGWFLSEWFGYYNTSAYTGLPPWLWIFHAEHGFLYRFTGSTDESMFFYDDAMGAVWWTNETVYPFLHVWDPPADNGGTDIENAWLWYFEGSITPRSFGIVTGASAGEFLSFDP